MPPFENSLRVLFVSVHGHPFLTGLRKSSFHVQHARDRHEAIALLHTGYWDVVILGAPCPWPGARALHDEIGYVWPQLPVILMSGDEATVQESETARVVSVDDLVCLLLEVAEPRRSATIPPARRACVGGAPG